jgi:chromosomal replication initiation ATPase DnaA
MGALPPDREVLLAERIQALVAKECGVSILALMKGHGSRVAADRQVAMFLIRERTRLSSTELGKLFKRDHATVLQGIRRVKERLESGDAWTGDLIRRVREGLDRA